MKKLKKFWVEFQSWREEKRQKEGRIGSERTRGGEAKSDRGRLGRLRDSREEAVGTKPGPGRCRNRLRRRSGDSISHNILDAWNMHYRAGKLSQVGQVALLPADQGGETLSNSSAKGLLSVKIASSLPSGRTQKCRREE